MCLRKVLVRPLLSLYPAAWRKEYGEELRSMLLAQPLTASVIGDVFLNAMRENLRRPDPWKIALLILLSWRTFWILWASISQLSPEIWAPFVQVDRSLFLLVVFSTACRTTINDGGFGRGVTAGFWPAWLAVNLAPFAAALLLICVASNRTVPSWAFATTDQFDNSSMPHHVLLSRALAAWCGALLGHLIRKRAARSRPTPQPSR